MSSGDLERLAAAYGVATSYEDHRHRQVRVPPDTVRAVLAAMGVTSDSDQAVEAALAAAEERPWRRLVPPTVLCVDGAPVTVVLHPAESTHVQARLHLEDGGVRPLPVAADGPRRTVDGVLRVARPVDLPRDLPRGYHTLRVETGEASAEALVIAAPSRCPSLSGLPPQWGWMLQLYALRSRASWGIGDFADLRQLATTSARSGAGFVLCNPLHAATPTLPLEPSPYFPSSRRFTNPIYLRVEDVPELADAPPAVRDRVGRLAAEARARNTADRIDRDAAWAAKLQALELLRMVPGGRERRGAFRTFREASGKPLEDFAVFCALAERHGPAWRRWPDRLTHPSRAGVAAARRELSDRVTFHAWLHFCCDEQLAGVQRGAVEGGMPVGVLSDLAVGVSPDGADAWSMQDDLAGDVTAGCPPDAFNQQGQDWRLPPLRPDRLAATGFAPFRELIAPALRHAGGIRIDHVLGLFRLWWVPRGASPRAGCYVRYPARGLLAVLALEAERAGEALVVGEDLGTVADEIRKELDAWGVFGSRVVYFERTPPDHTDPGRRLRAAEYPPQTLASVTTHDLPTVAGWWADEELRVQEDLGLLGEDTTIERERQRKARERGEMIALLQDEGLLDPGDGEDPTALREALHAFLARSRARLVAAQPADAVGDLRQPNQPGTVDEYPNWRLPVAEPTKAGARPLVLEELLEREEVARLARVLSEGRVAAARRASGAP